jgi:hypothetical protein
LTYRYTSQQHFPNSTSPTTAHSVLATTKPIKFAVIPLDPSTTTASTNQTTPALI